jgi:hypothetical protein
MSWHAEPDLLARYAVGRIDDVSAISVEAHLPSCASCRAALASAVDRSRLDRMWGDVIDAADRPQGTFVERILLRLGVPDGIARLAATAPALRPSWIVAIALALASALAMTRVTGPSDLAFLLIAPILPVIGVALAYGPGMDDAYEIGLASPMGGFRLVLVRTVAAVGVSVALAGIASVGLPELGWTVAWLLPSLALTVLTLALSASMTPVAAAAAVATVWIAGALGAMRLDLEPLSAFRPGGQVVFAAIATGAAAMVFVRRTAYELRNRM